MTGKERVMAVVRGEKPDRQPLFDLLRNDAVLEHFAGEKLTFENATRVTRIAHARAVDGTRGLPKIPVPPISDILPDGRPVRYERWFRWAERKQYADLADYVRQKKATLAGPILSEEEKTEARNLIAAYSACEAEYLSDIAFFWSFGVHDKHQFGVESRSLQGYYLSDLYEEIGLDRFCLWFMDEPSLVSELLERHFRKSIEVIRMLPGTDAKAPDRGTGSRAGSSPRDGRSGENAPQAQALRAPLGLCIADDIAFKSGPFLDPGFFEREYFPRLKEVCAAAHERGFLVFFHTDGDLRLLIDGLVHAGIDILNPIEKAPFFVREIHSRCPKLTLAGSIDISWLLPFGKPEEVRDEVRRVIDDAEGRILIGSSSILLDTVPVANFLAMREAVNAV